ncbi:MAG: hypothetical protein RR654_09820 [Oscillospiraceae bacterium]
MEKRKETPQERWQRNNMKGYAFKVATTTEADIIAKLDSVSNKAGYIKSLIRKDLADQVKNK